MKKLAIFGLTFIIPMGAYANTCGYDTLQSKEYKVSDKYKKYVTNSFIVDPNKGEFGFGQRSKRKYSSLQNKPFKVLSTNYVTADSSAYADKPDFERYHEIVINDKAYKLDKYYNIEVLTSDCVKYYYSPRGMKENFDYTFQKTDGSVNTTQDFLDFLGQSLKQAKVKAVSKYDDFDQVYEIKTDFFKDQMIRGYLKLDAEETMITQVYMSLMFFDKWGFINTAKDRNGNSHEVTTIDKDADCSNTMGLGCRLTETVGITVDQEFLKENRDGFELKLSGKQSKVVFVSGELVRAFLTELDSLKKRNNL